MGSPGYAKFQFRNLGNQGGMASVFGDQGQDNYNQMTQEAAAQREALRRRAMGQDSLSSEQLRQGLQQQYAQQRSMAAGANPANAAMAARTAAMGMGRASSGMAGQAATAGIQERAAAEKQLSDMILGGRQQDVNVALGSRSNAINAFGTQIDPGKSKLEQAQPYVNMGIGMLGAMSDERLKKNVKDADEESKQILKGLKAYRFDYKNDKHGKGSQFGIMAQDLEKAGLGHAVMDTPEGKAVNGAKLSTSNTAMIASLGRRLQKLEKGSK